MSIETDLSRIADSLEVIAKHLTNPQYVTPQFTGSTPENPTPINMTATEIREHPGALPIHQAPVPPAPAPAAPAAPVAAPTPPAPAAPSAPAQAAAGPLLSDADMNDAVVVEFNRLGSRDTIMETLKTFGVSGVSGLNADQQQQILAAVRAIPAAS